MSYESLLVICQVAAMAIFGGVMLAILIHVFRPGNRMRFEAAARMPLGDHDLEKGTPHDRA